MISKHPDRNLAWTVVFDMSGSYPTVLATNDAGEQLQLAFDGYHLFTMPVVGKGDTVCFVSTAGTLTLIFENDLLLGTKILKGGETKPVVYGDAVPRISKATCVIVDNMTGTPAVWGGNFPMPR